MFSERLLDIFAAIAANNDGELGSLCTVATKVTGVSAAGIALTVADASMIGFCASDDMARSLIDLEITVGEGPGSMAFQTDAIVSCDDLATRTADWVLYTPSALDLGVRSVVAVPIRIGAVRLGVLCLYHVAAGDLSDQQSTDAVLMASVAGRGIVALQAGVGHDAMSSELMDEGSFDFSVHQAAGMVAVQAGLPIASALVMLRMHAFAITENITRVASKVIGRQLRFDPIKQDWMESA